MANSGTTAPTTVESTIIPPKATEEPRATPVVTPATVTAPEGYERLACPVCGALALEPDKHAATHTASGRNENSDDKDNVYNEFAAYETVPGGTWFCNSCSARIVDTTQVAGARK